MATENNNDGNTQKTPEQMAEEARVAEEKRINDLVQARVDESLKEIKENLNKAYSQRDDFQKKLAEKTIEIGKKRHEKIQTRDVRKRMKKSKNKASLNNSHKKEFFLKRWFTPKQRTKRR